jgi:hypothetical protein
MNAPSQTFPKSSKSDGVAALQRHTHHFHSASGFATQTLASMLDSLVRVSRRVGERHFVHACSQGASLAPRPHPPTRSAVNTPLPRRAEHNRRSTRTLRFPLNGFRSSFTLFSKCFSPFLHSTCSLSVSRPYLAFDGVYHPLGAAFPSNPTRRACLVQHHPPGQTRGSHPLRRPVLTGTWTWHGTDSSSLDYNSKRAALRFPS